MEPFEVFAIKYAQHARRSGANFIGGDLHDGEMPMDYFVWVARNSAGSWVIDTGFGEVSATRRGREFLRCPAAALSEVGVDAEAVRDVIVTHLHYDHIGNFPRFPNATFHLQEKEMSFATGRHMAHKCMHEAYEVEDVVSMVRATYAGRVAYHDGDAEITPGLSVHLVGGHTMGLQVVRVLTKRGWIVLASDASHYYRNYVEERPFPIVYNVGDMVLGWSRIRSLSASSDHIIPGHDPEVLKRYPSPRGNLIGVVASLHEVPAQAGARALPPPFSSPQ